MPQLLEQKHSYLLSAALILIESYRHVDDLGVVIDAPKGQYALYRSRLTEMLKEKLGPNNTGLNSKYKNTYFLKSGSNAVGMAFDVVIVLNIANSEMLEKYINQVLKVRMRVPAQAPIYELKVH